MRQTYLPEGRLLERPDNLRSRSSLSGLEEAMAAGKILEARASLCTAQHDLWVDLGFCRGVIPRAEGALGIADGSARDIAIISRVGKPVCFKVAAIETGSGGEPLPILSRRLAQEECREFFLSRLVPGDIIDARVTRLEPFGCFVDVGCGISSLIPIDSISVSRISHPRDRFVPGQYIRAVVKRLEGGRLFLSHKELLGTWEENASLFQSGEAVPGIIRSVEEYGVFVELTPNLAGLAEPRDDVFPGQQASVYIKSLLPEKMKVKLIIVDAFEAPLRPAPPAYFVEGDHIDRFVYSPPSSPRRVETIFSHSDSDIQE